MNSDLRAELTKYYKRYYKDELGLPDWESRIKLRFDEENYFCKRFITFLERWLNYDFTNKKILVIGSGTGGELIKFHNMGANVYGLEPDEHAIKITKIKAKEISLSTDNIIKGYAEDLPFSDLEFDFVYCFTVLEHVVNVEKSISEMIRCTKKDGKIFIETPDYRQLFEGHYKLPLPMFLPKWINKLLLMIIGRPTQFLGTIQKVNSRQLRKIFSKYPVTSIKINKFKDSDEMKKPNSVIGKTVRGLQNIIENNLGIPMNQIWVLHKEK